MKTPDEHNGRDSSLKENYESLLALVNSYEYQELQRYYQSETFMDIAGISRRENSHSSFLAWLFDPSKSHGLGTFALEKLLETVMLAYTNSWFQKQFNAKPQTEQNSPVNFFHPANQKWHSAIRSFCVAIDSVEIKREWTDWKPDDEKSAARLDIWICAKIRDKRKPDAPPTNLWIAIENKVGSIENQYDVPAQINKAPTQTERKYQTVLYWDLLKSRVSSSQGPNNDVIQTLIMPIFLSPVPQSSYKYYLHRAYNESEELLRGIARSDYFFTLNYQYLLDGVLELSQQKTGNPFSATLIENYIHCLGRAIDASDDSEKPGKGKASGYLVLATGKREKQLVLTLWEKNRVVLTSLLKAGLKQNGIAFEPSCGDIDYDGHYKESLPFYQSFFLTLQELEREKRNKENGFTCNPDESTRKDKSDLLSQYTQKMRTKNKQPEFHFNLPGANGQPTKAFFRSGLRKPKSLGWLAHELIRVWCEGNQLHENSSITEMREKLLNQFNPERKTSLWIGLVCVTRKELETNWGLFADGQIPESVCALWTASYYFLDDDLTVHGKETDFEKFNIYHGTMALDKKRANHISVSNDPQDDLFVAHWWSEQNILDLLQMEPFSQFYIYNPATRTIDIVKR